MPRYKSKIKGPQRPMKAVTHICDCRPCRQGRYEDSLEIRQKELSEQQAEEASV